MIHQSHKNNLSRDSLNKFRRMAQNKRIGVTPTSSSYTPEAQPNLYIDGLTKLRDEFRKKGLKRFQPSSLGVLCLRDHLELQKGLLESEHTSGSQQPRKENDSDANQSSLMANEQNSDSNSLGEYCPGEQQDFQHKHLESDHVLEPQEPTKRDVSDTDQ